MSITDIVKRGLSNRSLTSNQQVSIPGDYDRFRRPSIHVDQTVINVASSSYIWDASSRIVVLMWRKVAARQQMPDFAKVNPLPMLR
ncbi:hypothetical protein [Xanthomonas sp. LMC-A-07]|uniref:hypothetical protein n=1 Tax=Xanthomonas sp. LMC-A-07 TaxID=3040329 RepID=UPI002552BEEB|nr:hypothetical protein [Xanthomonas sp. LMC-A-07]